MTSTFRGWIPAVSGRLSFSVFGRTSLPTEAVTANVADRERRFLASYQARYSADVLLPFKRVLAPILFGVEGEIWFVFVANTQHSDDRTQEFLCGTAFMFTDKRAWRQAVLPELTTYQRHLRAFRFPTHGSVLDYAMPVFDHTTEYCRSLASFYADVRISRTGTTEISVPDPLKLNNRAPKLPDEPRQRTHIIYILAAQIFVFLKDIGHRHQHHDPATDTIVDLCQVEPDDDLSWRLSTLYAMYRKVIDYKRNPHVSTFNNCLGIIAYASTFLAICKEELSEEQEKKLPVYFSDYTATSIKATQSKIERDLTTRQKLLDTARTTVLAVLGLLLSFVGLLKLTKFEVNVTPDPLYTRVVTLLLTRPLPTIALVALFVLMVVWATNYKYKESWTLTVKIMRVLQALPMDALAAILLLCAALTALLFVTLLY